MGNKSLADETNENFENREITDGSDGLARHLGR